MHRASTNEEREAQLSDWEMRLCEKENDLDGAIRQFRDEMEREAKRLSKMQLEVAEQESKVRARERAVEEREAAVLAVAQQVRDSLAAAAPPEAAASRSPYPAGTPGSASRTAKPSASPHMAQATPPAGNTRSVSPGKYAEGAVHSADPTLGSYVEELSDSDSDGGNKSTPRKRGLQGSPQFQPMDPKDSGRGFLRRKSSIVVLKDEHSTMQDDFDEAAEFLIQSGLMTEAQVLSLYERGIHPQDLIDQFMAAAQGQGGAAAGGHAYDENDDEDEYADEEGYYEDEEEHEGEAEEGEIEFEGDGGAQSDPELPDLPERPGAPSEERRYSEWDDSDEEEEDDEF